jgi:N-acetylglucosamine-6-phosphate deacetylase
MDRGVENLMRIGGLRLADAVRMATTNAAKAGKVPQRSAGLAPGERADLVFFRRHNGSIHVTETWLAGHKVYGA